MTLPGRRPMDSGTHGLGREGSAQSCQPRVPLPVTIPPVTSRSWPDRRVPAAGRTTRPCRPGWCTRGCARSPWRSRGAARHRAPSCTPSTSCWASGTARTAVSRAPPFRLSGGQSRARATPAAPVSALAPRRAQLGRGAAPVLGRKPVKEALTGTSSPLEIPRGTDFAFCMSTFY